LASLPPEVEVPLPLRLGFIELPVVGEVPGVAELAAGSLISLRALRGSEIPSARPRRSVPLHRVAPNWQRAHPPPCDATSPLEQAAASYHAG
jgi:hypothetical protein